MRTTIVGSFALAILILFRAPPSVTADTIATFGDPAVDGSTPLFSLSANTLMGGWSGAGLTLTFPISGDTFTDATFVMTPLTVGAPAGQVWPLSAGTIHFMTSSNAMILAVDFESAFLVQPEGLEASDLALNGVTFSGPTITQPLQDEQFTFSFANQMTWPGATTWTASFTASGTIMPEPQPLALAALGLIALRRR